MMLLVAMLAIGSEPDGVIGLETEERIPVPSHWGIKSLETDGKRSALKHRLYFGYLSLNQKRGTLFVATQFYDVTVRPGGPAGYGHVDLVYMEGQVRRSTHPGIYRFDGDRLILCFAYSATDRPTDFTTKPGDGRELLILTRGK